MSHHRNVLLADLGANSLNKVPWKVACHLPVCESGHSASTAPGCHQDGRSPLFLWAKLARTQAVLGRREPALEEPHPLSRRSGVQTGFWPLFPTAVGLQSLSFLFLLVRDCFGSGSAHASAHRGSSGLCLLLASPHTLRPRLRRWAAQAPHTVGVRRHARQPRASGP